MPYDIDCPHIREFVDPKYGICNHEDIFNVIDQLKYLQSRYLKIGQMITDAVVETQSNVTRNLLKDQYDIAVSEHHECLGEYIKLIGPKE